MTLSVKKTMILKSIMAVVIVTCMFQQQIADGSTNNQENLDFEIMVAETIQDSIEFEATAGFSHVYSKVGNWSDSGEVHKVIVEDDYAYVADGSNGFRILDASNISDITQLGFYKPNSEVCYDFVLGDIDGDLHAFLAYGANGVVILNLDNKLSPNVVGQDNSFLIGTNETIGIDVDGNYAYLACEDQGLVLVSYVDETTPVKIGQGLDIGEYARSIVWKQDGSQEFVFITYRDYGLGIINVGNPVTPSLAGTYTDISDPFDLAVDFQSDARYVYVSDQNGFYIIAVWNPANPVCPSEYRYVDTNKALSVSLEGNKAFVTYENLGLRIFNISARTLPVIDGIVGTFDDGNDGSNYNLNTFVLDEYCYYADGDDGFKVVELDSDGDALYDGDEINVYLTDETEDDTDDDQLLDGEEVFDFLTDPLDNDTDDDLILDGEETIVGVDNYITDPLNNDTDGDTFLDSHESFGTFYPTSPNANGTGYIFTNPLIQDTDGDGIKDGIEYHIHGSDPTSVDTDSDGMDDYFEATYGLSILLDDKDDDKDMDGVINIDEYTLNLNPSNTDTDADSLTDGEELYGIYWPTNPYANSTGHILTSKPLNSDADGDGLKDGLEVKTYFSNPLDTDSDSDGIDDFDEIITYLTFANSTDTDADTMGDYWEITKGTNPLRDDTADDNDTDGLTHLQEFTLNTNPLLADTDGDGMNDGWEVDHDFNPLVADGNLDFDHDGLTNVEEHDLGTDPLVADTDSDGMDDEWEADNGTDPLVDDASDDPDEDGLTNIEEYDEDTDPFDEDSDNDGLSDSDEVKIHGTDPNKFDTDGDGVSDAKEIAAGSDPLNENSTPTSRRNTLALAIGLSVSIFLVAVLTIFILSYRHTRPNQRMFRYIESQRAKGKVSLSTKEITEHLDKKLNKGQIKQLVVAHSEEKDVMLDGNTIWLTSDVKLKASIEEYKQLLSDLKTERPTTAKINSLTKKIETDRKAASKLKLTKLDGEYAELLADLEEISIAKKSKPAPVIEPEIVEEASTETFSMPVISSQPTETTEVEDVSDEEETDS